MSPASKYPADPPSSVGDLVRRHGEDSLLGKVVRVFGHASQNGTMLQSPFGERIGVAMALQIYRSNWYGKKSVIFTCERTTAFSLASDTSVTIAVNPGNWQLDFKKSWDEINIFHDPHKIGVNRIWSGGTVWDKLDNLTEKPHAHIIWKNFWHDDKFCMHSSALSDRDRDLNRLGSDGIRQERVEFRGAVERVLYDGVPCAVTGKLGLSDEGQLTLSPPGVITNRDKSCPQLAQMTRLPAGRNEPGKLVQLGDVPR
jgi:hypothetical protein